MTPFVAPLFSGWTAVFLSLGRHHVMIPVFCHYAVLFQEAPHWDPWQLYCVFSPVGCPLATSVNRARRQQAAGSRQQLGGDSWAPCMVWRVHCCRRLDGRLFLFAAPRSMANVQSGAVGAAAAFAAVQCPPASPPAASCRRTDPAGMLPPSMLNCRQLVTWVVCECSQWNVCCNSEPPGRVAGQ